MTKEQKIIRAKVGLLELGLVSMPMRASSPPCRRIASSIFPDLRRTDHAIACDQYR